MIHFTRAARYHGVALDAVELDDLHVAAAAEQGHHPLREEGVAVGQDPRAPREVAELEPGQEMGETCPNF